MVRKRDKKLYMFVVFCVFAGEEEIKKLGSK